MTGKDIAIWTIFSHDRQQPGREFSQTSTDLEGTLTWICRDLLHAEVIRIEGPNGECYSFEDIKQLCASRRLLSQQ